MVETPLAADAPKAEFRIRFSRTRGLTALFEPPANSYRWVGHGTLRVEPNGVQLLARTRRLFVLPRTQRRYVLGPQISEVYRQADGVRVELRENSRHAVLNFWAEDAASAARIVRLLPTARTVEFDEVTQPSRRSPASSTRTFVAALATIALALLGSAVWWASERFRARTISPAPAVRAGSPTHAALSAPSMESSLSASERAQIEANWARFAEHSEALRAQYRVAFDALLNGSLSQEDFANGLTHWLIPQWTSEQRNLREMTFPASSAELREELLRSAENWEAALAAYARGLNEQDVQRVQLAFTYMRAAEDAEGRAWKIVKRARAQSAAPE
jgi:hypothetical protein